MPFKTKRQKIAAAQKRYVFSNGKVSFGGVSQSATDDLPKNRHINSRYADDAADLIQNNTLKPEIIKIGVISLLIIGFQITLRMVPTNVWLGVFH